MTRLYCYLIIYKFTTNRQTGTGRAIISNNRKFSTLQDFEDIKNHVKSNTNFGNVEVLSIQLIDDNYYMEEENPSGVKTYH